MCMIVGVGVTTVLQSLVAGRRRGRCTPQNVSKLVMETVALNIKLRYAF